MSLTNKILALLGLGALFIMFVLFPILCHAGVETVKDDNDGQAGYILVNTGTKNGQSDVGHWTDASFLKGDKGDTGATGATGIGLPGVDGKDGMDGFNGLDGKDGYTPVKGVDYVDGLNGIDGKDGLDGGPGKDGLNGADGANIKGDKGDQGNIGQAGVEGKAGKDVDPALVNSLTQTNTEQSQQINSLGSRLNKLERTQYVLNTSFRVVDTKRITLSPFFRQNFTRNKIDEVGLNVVVKLGQSYEERQINKINKRLAEIERVISNAPVVEKVVDAQGHLQSISVISGGLNVNGSF